MSFRWRSLRVYNALPTEIRNMRCETHSESSEILERDILYNYDMTRFKRELKKFVMTNIPFDCE